MPSFLDFMERATTGPMLSEHEFNRKILIPNVRKAAKEFEIRYAPESPVPSDDGLSDHLKGGGTDSASTTG